MKDRSPPSEASNAGVGRGWAAGAEDIWTAAITRHLAEAAALLKA